MSADIAPRAADQLARAPKPASPLRVLPEEWRPFVAAFYAFHGDVLKGVAGIATRFRVWAKATPEFPELNVGLTLAEATAVMRRLMTPARCGEFQYAGQLLAALAEEVAIEVKRRKAVGRMLADREQADRDRVNAAPVAEVRRLAEAFGIKGAS